jgi:8-oxo-dGTP diphosphatase
MTAEASLNYLIKDNQVLLMEKQNKIGAGKLNGLGGKMDPSDKNIEVTMIRESYEEATVIPLVYKKMAEILFHNPSDDETLRHMLVHMFVTTSWHGKPKSSNEMKNPKWFDIDDLLVEKAKKEMMPGDHLFIKEILTGTAMRGTIVFNDDWTLNEELSHVEPTEDFE